MSNYSKMGKKSWECFVKVNGIKQSRKLMSEKGKKGWLALVERLGSEEEAKKYIGALGRASFFQSTRPGFSEKTMKPYFDQFPNIKDKFTQ